ncbi:MAG: DUF3592 domain-containing protein [Gammaproteobacteria bacterium HGW-Gammaproteobacteria-11]|nr:MAG: DUF3592 domain-containing protein [Gammaproteobacteria bacterium HGW-Gammaproteobacteria-11]
MKILTIIKYGFTLLGIALLLGAFFLYQNTQSFLADAATAEGVVTALTPSRSTDSVTYRPVVRFATQDGEVIEFTSTAGSNPPSYATGEQVEVLYSPANPNSARIKGFFSLWGGASITGGLGGLFFILGGGFMLSGALSVRQANNLKVNGTRIQADYQGVQLNTGIQVNGNCPFQVLAHWINPMTSELHIFKSNNIWFDPSSHIPTDKITVYIDRNNPKKYHMDTSFLPKLA